MEMLDRPRGRFTWWGFQVLWVKILNLRHIAGPKGKAEGGNSCDGGRGERWDKPFGGWEGRFEIAGK